MLPPTPPDLPQRAAFNPLLRPYFVIYGAGVLALLVSPERFCINGMDYHIVIVPTSPVPVGGGLIFVPVDAVKPADVSVEALMSIYVSMGVTAPQFLSKPAASAAGT